jgi:fucose 4-O-acetylase-like acetyltransferase
MIDSSTSRRISMLRTLLVLSVVFLHVKLVPRPTHVDFSDLATVLRAIFQDRFGRAAVPTLSLISGYLLYSAKLDLTPGKLYKKKFRTLLVPFLFFNVLYFLAQYWIEYLTGWAPLYILTTSSLAETVEYLSSYLQQPLNAPLHFLRDLFVLALLAPVFGFFIRNRPWLGLAIVCGVFLPDLDGHLVNRNTMAVLFYVGGMAAVGQWNLRKYDHLAIPALVALLALCAGTVFYRVDSPLIVYLVSPPLVWITSAWLVDTAFGKWAIAHSKYSFFVFLAHFPLLRALGLAQAKFHLQAPPMITMFGTMLIVVCLLCMAYNAAMAVMPDTFNMLIGERAVRPATAPRSHTAERPTFVERRKTPRAANAPVYNEAVRMRLLDVVNDTGFGAADPLELNHRVAGNG